MMKPIVEFKALADGTVETFAQNYQGTVVSAEKMHTYMNNLLEVTGGTEVEFNNTLRQKAQNRVYFAFQQYNSADDARRHNMAVPEVFEIVLLNNQECLMNNNGIVTVIVPEATDVIYATKTDAELAAKEYTKTILNSYIDSLVDRRHQLKDEVRKVSSEIDDAIAKRNELLK